MPKSRVSKQRRNICSSKRRGFTRELRDRIIKRDKNKCRYCGDVATCVDHIIPIEFMPIHHASNLVASCYTCNAKLSWLNLGDFEAKKAYLEKNLFNDKKVTIWTEEEVDELGDIMKKKVLNECIIVKDDLEANKIFEYFEHIGLEPKYYGR